MKGYTFADVYYDGVIFNRCWILYFAEMQPAMVAVTNKRKTEVVTFLQVAGTVNSL